MVQRGYEVEWIVVQCYIRLATGCWQASNSGDDDRALGSRDRNDDISGYVIGTRDLTIGFMRAKHTAIMREDLDGILAYMLLDHDIIRSTSFGHASTTGHGQIQLSFEVAIDRLSARSPRFNLHQARHACW